jgi:hypothetical protein
VLSPTTVSVRLFIEARLAYFVRRSIMLLTPYSFTSLSLSRTVASSTKVSGRMIKETLCTYLGVRLGIAALSLDAYNLLAKQFPAADALTWSLRLY